MRIYALVSRGGGAGLFRGALGLALALSLLAVGTSEPTDAAGSAVATSPVCFVVHNPNDPSFPAGGGAAAVRGTRFYASNSNRSRVLILVSGINSWSKVWDFRPNFSVARRLAEGGFLVFTYDFLGTGASSYPYPLRATLTSGGLQTALHEIVEQVRGTSVLRPGEANPCAGSRPLGVGPSPRVTLIGHSAGAGLVAGYAGLYHGADRGRVNAEVLASFALCLVPSSPCVQTYLQKAAANQGQEASFFLDNGSYRPYLAAKSVAPQPCRPTFLACVGGGVSGSVSPPSGQCRTNIDLLLWPQATPAQADLRAACDPANWETWPTLEWDSESSPGNLPLGLLGAGTLTNTPAGFPVLVTWTDHDGFDATDSHLDPADEQANQRAMVATFRSSAPVRLTSWTEKNAGHAIFLSATMPTWTAEVISWLHTIRFS